MTLPATTASPTPAPSVERWLRYLLRLGAVMTLLAFPTALLPTATMESTHQRLGLGVVEIGAVFEYMARSLSLLYGFHGGLLLLVSFDLRRYAPIIKYLGCMNIGLGLGLLAVDLHAGLPWWWTWGEGPGIVGMGCALLWLNRRLSLAEPARAQRSYS